MDHHVLLDEARQQDVEKFYENLGIGPKASTNDPFSRAIALTVQNATERLVPFLDTVKGKPIALVTVRILF